MAAQDNPKLYIFLGAGGVGKTTLSASFAIALANEGRKVGLLSIDPAKRLQSALGIDGLTDEGILIPLENTQGELRACVLHTEKSFVRWVEESKMNAEDKKKLFANPYFSALADKIASSGDILAAIRVAEFIEKNPHVTDLVIDTAPGISAIDFIVKPEKALAFLDSKMIDWIRGFGAQKILSGFRFLGGKSFLSQFAQFLILIDDILFTVRKRLKYTQSWLFHSDTSFILVTSVRNDAGKVAKELAKILKSMEIEPRACIINRAVKRNLQMLSSELAGSMPFINFLLNYARTQKDLYKELDQISKQTIELPILKNLDAETKLRMSDLCDLGTKLRRSMG